jgi:hypothetical protein
VLQPTCTLAGLQLSQLQPLVTLRSLELPCAPCWQHTVLLFIDNGGRVYVGNVQWLPLQLCGHPAPGHGSTATNLATAES